MDPCLKRPGLGSTFLSLLQHQSTSQEKHGRLRTTTHFQHQSTGYLRTRGQETLYETCAACALSTFSVTSEESLRDSEPPDIFIMGIRAPRDRTLHDLSVYETCACVIHANLHTLSAACALELSSCIIKCLRWACAS